MPLNDILSAMRALILDADDGPTDPAARRAWIGERFPTLTATEADDLASVPAERFGVYTETIFAGERSMLRWAFPMSMAAIGRMLGEQDASQPIGHLQYDLVRDLHRFRPWQSHSIRDLARGFRAFVGEKRGDLLETWPGLADLIAFEQAELEVFYAADAPLVALRPDEWSGMSVEALLMSAIVIPTHVEIIEVRFDAIALRRQWRIDESLPDGWPADEPSYFACGRDPDSLQCRWIKLNAASQTALTSMPRGDTRTINDLAAGWLASQPEDAFTDDAAAFAAFCGLLADWARAGIVMAPDDASSSTSDG